MAVDSSKASYWASKFDDTHEPVVFTLDIGAAQRLQSIEVAWEFPAKAFSVSCSVDGIHFADAYSTDVNILNTTRAPLDVTAKLLKITMIEARLYAPRVHAPARPMYVCVSPTRSRAHMQDTSCTASGP